MQHLPALVPEHATTHTPLRVRFCETDLMGIVHHSNYLRYFEAGRVDWLRRRAVNYAGWAVDGLHLAVVESGIRHRAPARFDDLLDVETRLAELGHVSLRFEYLVTCGATRVAEGFVRLACIDDKQTLKRLPPFALQALTAPEAPGTANPTPST